MCVWLLIMKNEEKSEIFKRWPCGDKISEFKGKFWYAFAFCHRSDQLGTDQG